MKIKNKEDFEEAKLRIEAWWNGEIIDRVPIMITAPKKNNNKYNNWIYPSAFPLSGIWDGTLTGYEKVKDPESFFTDPNIVIPRIEKLINDTFWGGEAIPVMFPVSIVAALAHYLGSPIKFINAMTTWAEPVINSWSNRKEFKFDPENEWWKKSKILLEEASKRANGRYMVSIPDLNGPAEILSILRGNEQFAIDTIESPDEIIRATQELNYTWLKYWEACHEIIHQYIKGYTFFMSIWSDFPATDLQCDFSTLISPESFNKLFIPFIEQQSEWIPRNIYHLDGPGALVHLNLLLSVPGIKAIQWVPGAGSAPMSEWITLLKKIQEKGKSLFLSCEKWEVEKIVKELKPEGLLLETTCGSIREAEAILSNVRKWT